MAEKWRASDHAMKITTEVLEGSAVVETKTGKLVLGGAQAEERATWWEQQQARLDKEMAGESIIDKYQTKKPDAESIFTEAEKEGGNGAAEECSGGGAGADGEEEQVGGKKNGKKKTKKKKKKKGKQAGATLDMVKNSDSWASKAFLAQCPPKPSLGKLLFFGDSDIARWDTEPCFPEFETVQCGVIGSLLSDAADFASYVVNLFQPETVVLVAGENDLCEDQAPVDVQKELQRCVEALTAREEKLHVFYFGAKLEPATLELQGMYEEYNALAKAYCDETEGVTYIDCYSAMLLSARGRGRGGGGAGAGARGGDDRRPRPQAGSPRLTRC
jgi:hypothetical protein